MRFFVSCLIVLLTTSGAVAQSRGVWVSDIAALQYEDPTRVGGYWDEGLDFSVILSCTPNEQTLWVELVFPSTEPTEFQDQTIFVRLGQRDFVLPWANEAGPNGFAQFWLDDNGTTQRWIGQEDFIQLLMDGLPLVVMAASARDFSDARMIQDTDPGRGMLMFTALSNTCGYGTDLGDDIAGQLVPDMQPLPESEATAQTWTIAQATDFWTGSTAVARATNNQATAMITCGEDGQALLAVAIDDWPAQSSITFATVFIGRQAFSVTFGAWQGIFLSNPGQAAIQAMTEGVRMNIDTLTDRRDVHSFDLNGAAEALPVALQSCGGVVSP